MAENAAFTAVSGRKITSAEVHFSARLIYSRADCAGFIADFSLPSQSSCKAAAVSFSQAADSAFSAEISELP